MGVIERFSTIIKSNVNAMLDKAEDPAKMVDQILRDLNNDLAKVKQETANVMAEETRCKRELDECAKQVAKYDSVARKALQAGNEADARVMIEQKNNMLVQQEGLQQAYNVAKANADKMRQMHDKLVSDIKQMESRRATIKAKSSVAKAQQRMNKAVSGINSSTSQAAFSRMEARIDQQLDAANAMADLNTDADALNADTIAAKYSSGASAVDDDLARMKAELGL